MKLRGPLLWRIAFCGIRGDGHPVRPSGATEPPLLLGGGHVDGVRVSHGSA